jgi:polysaccharide biosynthesis/export protein
MESKLAILKAILKRACHRRTFVPLACIGLLAACSTANNSPNAPVAQLTRELPAPQIVSAVPNAAQIEYRVGPLDLLEISVFRVPELSKTVKVTASGQIDMPLIGTVQAGGKTVAELEAEIAAKLEAKYLQSAQVNVFVKEANSQQVTVDGAVASPGMVSLTGQTTLLQTIAMSGGLAENADPRGILVFRTVNDKRSAAKFDLKAIRAGKAEDPVLYGGDIVVVDTSAFGSALASVRNSIPVFGLFTALSTAGI